MDDRDSSDTPSEFEIEPLRAVPLTRGRSTANRNGLTHVPLATPNVTALCPDSTIVTLDIHPFLHRLSSCPLIHNTKVTPSCLVSSEYYAKDKEIVSLEICDTCPPSLTCLKRGRLHIDILPSTSLSPPPPPLATPPQTTPPRATPTCDMPSPVPPSLPGFIKSCAVRVPKLNLKQHSSNSVKVKEEKREGEEGAGSNYVSSGRNDVIMTSSQEYSSSPNSPSILTINKEESGIDNNNKEMSSLTATNRDELMEYYAQEDSLPYFSSPTCHSPLPSPLSPPLSSLPSTANIPNAITSSQSLNKEREEGISSDTSDKLAITNKQHDHLSSINDHHSSLSPLTVKDQQREVNTSSDDSLPDFIKCCACQKKLLWKDAPVFEHERLQVFTCSSCHNIYHSGSFSVDSDGNENYCTLCGDGGQLILCDTCPKACCQTCISNVSGQSLLNELINSEGEWQCWSCDPSPILPQRELYQLFCESLRKKKKNRRMKRKERVKKDNTNTTQQQEFKSKEFISISDDSSMETDSHTLKTHSHTVETRNKSTSNKKKRETLNKLLTTRDDHSNDINGPDDGTGTSPLLKHENESSQIDSTHGYHGNILDTLFDMYDENGEEIKQEAISPPKGSCDGQMLTSKVDPPNTSDSSHHKGSSPNKESDKDGKSKKKGSNIPNEGSSDDAVSSTYKREPPNKGSGTNKGSGISKISPTKRRRYSSSSEEVHSSDISLSDVDLFNDKPHPSPSNKTSIINKQNNVHNSSLPTSPSSRTFKKNNKLRHNNKSLLRSSDFGVETIKVYSTDDSDLEESDDKGGLSRNQTPPTDGIIKKEFSSPEQCEVAPPKSANKRVSLQRKRRITSYDYNNSDSNNSNNDNKKQSNNNDTEDSKKDRTKVVSDRKGILASLLSPSSSSDENTNEVTKLVISSSDECSGTTNALLDKSGIIKKKENSTVGMSSFSLKAAISDTSSSEEELIQRKKKQRTVRLFSESSSHGGEGSSNERKGKGKIKRNHLSSDSEDFEQDSSVFTQSAVVLKKKRKRLKQWLTSGSSNNSSDSEGEEMRKVRKRKTTPTDKESEEELSQNTPSKRKNIRKLITKDKLALETKEAQKAEKERLERLKKKNEATIVIDDDNPGDKRIVLEQNTETKEVLLEVRHSLVPKILTHQIKGIKFLYNSVCEDLKRLTSEPGSGAILAHCMGLGKTLQVISFLDCLLSNSDTTNINRVIVLCPVNTLLNWRDEWDKWVSVGRRDYRLLVLDARTNEQRCSTLERWFKMGGVIILGYEMFRNLASGRNIKRTNLKETFAKYLLDPGADIVVCDEGHVLRQEKSNLSIVVNQVATKRRIVLTGTPLQNNLKEYYTMVNFVKPNLLGTLKEFSNRFVNPISNGQCADSSPADVRLMKQRAHILYQLLSGCVDRKDYRILAESLPPKHEYVVSIRMCPIQEELIKRYLSKNFHTAQDLFSTYAMLVKVWNHPWVIMLDQERKDINREDNMDDFIDDGSDDDSLEGFIVKGSGSEEEEEYKVKKKEKKKSVSSSRSTSKDPSPPSSTKSVQQPVAWFEDLLTDDCANNIELSGKLLFLMELLNETEKVGEKVLVFCQSLLMLDLIEDIIQQPQYDFIEGINYFRLDGSTKASDRTARMKRFNKKGSQDIRLFLISTKAGSLGVNLIGANRVVVFDACWNPSYDLQSIFRSYRFGQTKPVFVYRLLAQGTMEEKIYDRQVTKTSLSLRVIDERQIGRHYTMNQLQELFTYTPAPPPPTTEDSTVYDRPTADIIFCRILDKLQPKTIVKFHEHDSLLEHVFAEELSEEERKAAWDNYNAQKELESRAYNIKINMQQNNTITVTDQLNVLTAAVGGATGVSGLSINLKLIKDNVFSIVNEGLKKATAVKDVLDLRNHLIPFLNDQPTQVVIQRYQLTCERMHVLLTELQQFIPQIKQTLSSYAPLIPVSDKPALDVIYNAFLINLTEIDNATKVFAPDPKQFNK